MLIIIFFFGRTSPKFYSMYLYYLDLWIRLDILVNIKYWEPWVEASCTWKCSLVSEQFPQTGTVCGRFYKNNVKGSLASPYLNYVQVFTINGRGLLHLNRQWLRLSSFSLPAYKWGSAPVLFQWWDHQTWWHNLARWASWRRSEKRVKMQGPGMNRLTGQRYFPIYT